MPESAHENIGRGVSLDTVLISLRHFLSSGFVTSSGRIVSKSLRAHQATMPIASTADTKGEL